VLDVRPAVPPPAPPPEALRDAVASRVARIAPQLPAAAREALVAAGARFLTRWPPDPRADLRPARAE
jgi:hypothetical protein